MVLILPPGLSLGSRPDLPFRRPQARSLARRTRAGCCRGRGT
jgi:hypothetical protein